MATTALRAQNWFSTTLSSSISASDTTINLNSVPTNVEGYLVIEPDSSTNREVIYFTSKTSSAVVLPSAGAGRGQDGTSATSHASGASVKLTFVNAYWDSIRDGTAIANGAVTPSKWSNTYKFSAYRAAALSSPSGSQATVVFDTKRFDTSSNYSTSTGKFTAPVAGFYMFTSTALLWTAVTRIFLSWVKNGSVYRRSTDNASTGYAISDSLFIQLAVNDTIEVQLFTASSQAVDTTGQTEFTGFIVSMT